MSDSRERLDRVIASAPIDATAGRVTSKGISYLHDHKGQDERNGHSETPPKMKPIPLDSKVAVGEKFGRFTVVGMFDGGGGRYVVKCLCSHYEFRKQKAIKNPANSKDACLNCRRTAYLKKSSLYYSSGIRVEAEEFL